MPLSARHEVLRNMFKPLPGPPSGGAGGGGVHCGQAGSGSRGNGGCGDDRDGHDIDDGDVGDEDGLVNPADGSVLLGSPGGVVRGRVQLNVPCASEDLPENPHRVMGLSLKHIEEKLWERMDRHEEGLVIKVLESKWVPGDRGKWVKLKPDYLATDDLDCLIIGGFYGTGKHGGQISEYLLGILEELPQVGLGRSAPDTLVLLKVPPCLILPS